MATVDAQVLGHNATDYMMGNSDTEQQLVSALASGDAVTIGTNAADMDGLYGSHAYAVTAYNASTNTFTLYNPWGFDQPGQLSWSQLETACEGFVAVNAAGATAISGAVLKAGSIGYFAHDSVNPATDAADVGASNDAVSDSWFDHSGDVVGTNEAQVPSANGAANSAGNTTAGQATSNAPSGDYASLDDGAESQLSSLAFEGFDAGHLADPIAAQADMFYAAWARCDGDDALSAVTLVPRSPTLARRLRSRRR